MQDAEIIRLFEERDESAVSASLDKYRGYCMKIALNILGAHEEADECINRVFMKAWDMIPPHKPNNLAAFLGKLTRTTALNMRRDENALKRGGGETETVYDEISDAVPCGTNIEREAELNDLIEEINKFLKKLPEKKRNIFICRYWFCESVRDIAAEHSMTESNVSVTLNRVRQKLREHLRKRGYDYD